MTYQIQNTFDENFKIIANLNPNPQTLTTTYADVPNSHIDYKPSPSSTYVVYQYSSYFASDEGNDSGTVEINCFFKLQYSDDNGATFNDWGDNTECFIGSAAPNVSQRSTLDLKWTLDSNSWISTKRLRIVSKQDNGSNTILNQLETFFDSTGERTDTNKYNTSVSCYSVD